MGEITIRPAKPTIEEGLIFAELYDETSEEFFKALLGKRAYETIAEAYIRSDNEYSFNNVAFAEHESRIVGMVSGYGSSDKLNFQKRILNKTSKGNGFRVFVFGLLGNFLSRHLGPGAGKDFYLQAIVVSHTMRGKGIGRNLFEYIEEIAGDRKAQTLSLHVSSRNGRAMNLYHSRGMNEDSVWPDVPLLPSVFTRMVKKLSISQPLYSGKQKGMVNENISDNQ